MRAVRANPHRDQFRATHLAPKEACVHTLLNEEPPPPEAARRIADCATRLVEAVRAHRHRLADSVADMDTFRGAYRLSTQEGVVPMCLAEALLRIPDRDTVDRLIRDKIGSANWAAHLGHCDSAFVNASTWALMLTGRLIALAPKAGEPRAPIDQAPGPAKPVSAIRISSRPGAVQPAGTNIGSQSRSQRASGTDLPVNIEIFPACGGTVRVIHRKKNLIPEPLTGLPAARAPPGLCGWRSPRSTRDAVTRRERQAIG